MEHICRAIRSQQEDNVASVIPQNSQNIPAIPHEYCITTHGDMFLMHDSGPGGPYKLIISTMDDSLGILRSSNHCFADGKFEVSPSIFFKFRLFTRYVMIDLYRATYDRLLKEIN